MGVASYSEDIWLRWSEAADPLPNLPLTPRFSCPFCAEVFPSEQQRLSHLAAAHRGEAPELFICGRRIGLEDRIRERLRPSDVALSQHCTRARISVDGSEFEEVPVGTIPKLIARHQNALLDVNLENAFDHNISPIIRTFRVRIKIPCVSTLQAVENQFRLHFIDSKVTWDTITKFRISGGSDTGEDYRNALANYVQGVLIRDQISGTRVERDRAREVFNNALEELRGFERPLAQLVAGIVRFADNDFGDPSRPTGWQRLDRTRAILTDFGVPRPQWNETSSEQGKMIAVCPTDHGIDTVLDISEQLASKTYWSPHLTEELEARASASRLDPRDRIKILALWAYHALRFRATPSAIKPLYESAIKPLHEMIGDPVFGHWAESRLEELCNGH